MRETRESGLLLLGVNYKTAPVEVREQVAIPPGRLAEVTSALVKTPGVQEALIVSTCNRVELLIWGEAGSDRLVEFFYQQFSIEPSALRQHLYEYRQQQAVRHVFRVASSLDSMVVGEPQILGQVKEAYAVGRSIGTVQAGLEKLLQSAFSVAKRVRSETRIGSSSVSVASIAVDLAEKIFGSLEHKTVLLVGAGKMSELAARHLVQRGASTIYVTNRTEERAAGLAAGFGGHVVRYEDLHNTADRADIIITSTGSSTPIFRREHGMQFLHRRKNRPMFFIDIAVPRDVDPAMNDLEGIFLYDIDDLQSVAASHLINRAREAEAAEAIVTTEVESYWRKLQSLDVVPVIVGMQQSAEEMRQAELRRMETRLRGFSPEQRKAVEALTRGLMNKFLHPALKAVKQAASEGDAGTVEAIRAAFEGEKQSVFADLKEEIESEPRMKRERQEQGEESAAPQLVPRGRA